MKRHTNRCSIFQHQHDKIIIMNSKKRTKCINCKKCKAFSFETVALYNLPFIDTGRERDCVPVLQWSMSVTPTGCTQSGGSVDVK